MQTTLACLYGSSGVSAFPFSRRPGRVRCPFRSSGRLRPRGYARSRRPPVVTKERDRSVRYLIRLVRATSKQGSRTALARQSKSSYGGWTIS